MTDKVDPPIDAIELALLRKGSGGIEAVSIGKDGQVLSNGDKDTAYRLVIRSPTRSGPKEQSERARNLKSCKGLKGCEFAQCAEKAFGKLPKHLKGLCPIDKNPTDKNIMNNNPQQDKQSLQQDKQSLQQYKYS